MLSIWNSLKMCCVVKINSLPNNKYLDLSKFKAFADDKSNVVKLMGFLLKRTENIMGKGENASKDAYSNFPPQCSQNLFSCDRSL